MKYADCYIRNTTCTCLFVEQTHSSNPSVNEQKIIINIIIHIITTLFALNWQGRSASEASISFIFLWFFVHWHSDLKVPRLNLFVESQFYLQQNTHFTNILFHKVHQLPVQNTNHYFSPWKACFLRPGTFNTTSTVTELQPQISVISA
jgi:hypothetical protein